MTDRRAIFAGSFDPITNGHLALIERARTLFPLTVAVGDNERKRYLFDADRRVELVRAALEGTGVEVVRFDGLLVDLARERGCSVLVRGIRDVVDFGFEQQSARVNRALAPGVESVWLAADPAVAHISSSMVREIAACGGDVSPHVPPAVAEAFLALS